MKRSIKALISATVLLGAFNVAFSAYSRPAAVTPEIICSSLRSAGFATQCLAGTPWAFEILRHGAQWQFTPTSPEPFQCFTVTAGHKRLCKFKGAVTQFASAADLDAAMVQIRSANSQKYDDATPRHFDENAPEEGLIPANSTLEHYIAYRLPANVLVMMPVTEDGAKFETTVEKLFGKAEIL